MEMKGILGKTLRFEVMDKPNMEALACQGIWEPVERDRIGKKKT